MWEQMGWTRVVARYCRIVLAAEVLLSTQALAEARMLEDRLGLTPRAMRSLLWEIVADDPAEKREPTTVRGRLRAVG